MIDLSPVVAIITAREGSKGVINKNLRLVNGVSLIGRAILAAKKSQIFDHIVLTTDGQEIAKEGELYGAEVVLRPKELAGDAAKSIDAVKHAISTLGYMDGTVVLLQPTSPLRNHSHIREAFVKYKKTEAQSLCSVCEAEHHPFKFFVETDAGLNAIKDISYFDMPRQYMPKALRLNGALFINDISKLIRNETFYTQPIEVYEMDAKSSIDIDSELDLKLANMLAKEI
ncbi:acylneuraminate cytidylyltransferase family protein [Halomonas sp. TP35]